MVEQASAIILYNSDKEILLQHRTDDAPQDAGRWSFFGGGIEDKETPLECVKRECFEELEYDLENPFLLLKEFFKGKEIFVFIEEYNKAKKLNLLEGKDMGWFKLQDAINLDLAPGAIKVLEKLKEHF
jgi:8-oxo-dGTP pyrophosphatase MutT (NUDIX family)